MSKDENDKLDWMYKGASSHVDREEYLLGKTVDKSFEQLNHEEKEKKLGLQPPKNHVEHECIPPSIRDFNKIIKQDQVDLSAKLQEDPLVAIKKQEEEARRQFLQNPIQLKKLQEALFARESKKQKKKRKKKKHSNSEDDLDKQLSEKLRNLKGTSLATNLLKESKNETKGDHLDTILMHKYNQLKDKLSQKDIDDIMAGRTSSSEEEEDAANKKLKNRSLSSSSNDSREERKNKRMENQKTSVDRKESQKLRYRDFKENRKRHIEYSSSDSSGDRKNVRESGREKYEKYHKSRHNEKGRSDKIKDNQSSSRKYRRKSSSRSSTDESNKKLSNEKSNSKSTKSDDNLEKMILEKLRMLRDSKPQEKKDESEKQEYSHYDSDKDEYIFKKKSFGLVKSDGTKIPLKNPPTDNKKAVKKVIPPKPVDTKKTHKKLTDKEKEELRKQMLSDAVTRDKERSDNLRKHRQEKEREDIKIGEFDKNFLHRELLKGQSNLKDVESNIKSKLNNIQRSSQHMNSNFSKRN